MKKRILSMVLAATMVLGLAACGGESKPAGGENKPAEGGDNAGFQTSSTWKPSGTIKIVVPASAGGNTDLSARVLAQYIKDYTGVDAIVANTPGAAGSVAAQTILDGAADGMSFLYGHNLINVANVAGVTDYNYEAFKLGPTFAKDPAQQLYVAANKYKDLNAFIEAAKAAPGELTVATEVGAYTYYEVLAFQKAAGIELKVVDAGSNSEKIVAMLGGKVDLMPGAYINCKNYLTTGEFNVLGVPGEERFDLIKDIPTFKEQGIDLVYPDCDFSLYFKKDTDDQAIQWYEDVVKYITSQPDAQTAIAGVDMQPYFLTAAESVEHDKAYFETFKSLAGN